MPCIDSPLNQVAWFKKEVTPGTWQSPAASDTVMANGDMEFVQMNPPSENTEKNMTRIANNPNKQVKEVGTFSFPTHIKASGTPGTPPSVGPLLESWTGSQTIDPGVSVTYKFAEPATCAVTLSAVAKFDSKVHYIRGLKVNEAPHALQVGTDAAAILGTTFTGIFMNKSWAMKSTLSAAASISDTTIQVNDRHFTVGAYITVGTDDNGGAGFEITAVDKATGDLTITPAISIAQSLGDPVLPWTPAFTEPVETSLHGQYGISTVNKNGEGAANLVITGANINATDTITFTHQKNGLDYPTSIRTGERITIAGDYTYVETEDTGEDAIRAQEYHQTYALVIPWHSKPNAPAGEKYTVTIPNAQVTMPTVAVADAGIAATVAFTAHDSAADYDAISFVFD